MWTEKPFWPGFCAWRRPCLRPGARLAAGMCAAVLVMTVQGCSFPSSGAEIPPLPVLTSVRKLELNGRAGLWMSSDDAGRLALWIYDVTGEGGTR